MKNNKSPSLIRRFQSLLLIVLLSTCLAISLQGCMGLAVGGAVLAGSAAMDRRSIGAQTDDKAFVLKTESLISPIIGNKGTVDISAYNRSILLTGSVLDEATLQAALSAVRKMPDVKSVYNQIWIGFGLSLSQRSKDTYLTSRVIAALVNAQGISSSSFKVVTSNSVVYLMGIVTKDEGEIAANVASKIQGVTKIVTLFDFISKAELANMKQTAK